MSWLSCVMAPGQSRTFWTGPKVIGQRTRCKMRIHQNTQANQTESGLSVELCCVVREQDRAPANCSGEISHWVGGPLARPKTNIKSIQPFQVAGVDYENPAWEDWLGNTYSWVGGVAGGKKGRVWPFVFINPTITRHRQSAFMKALTQQLLGLYRLNSWLPSCAMRLRRPPLKHAGRFTILLCNGGFGIMNHEGPFSSSHLTWKTWLKSANLRVTPGQLDLSFMHRFTSKGLRQDSSRRTVCDQSARLFANSILSLLFILCSRVTTTNLMHNCEQAEIF